MRVEVWYSFNGDIEDVKIVQKSNVMDPASVNVIHQKVKCIDTDLEEKCDSTRLSAIFLEPLKDQVMAIKAIDFKFRDQTTYLNEGFEIEGKSLNPMATKMIPSQIRDSGLMKVTQIEKYSNYWISDEGRLFEMNDFGSFTEVNQKFERFRDSGEPRTRLHSDFSGLLALEESKAMMVFNSTKIISTLPDSFGYHYEFKERMTDELKHQMSIEEQKAKEFLEHRYLQARW